MQVHKFSIFVCKLLHLTEYFAIGRKNMLHWQSRRNRKTLKKKCERLKGSLLQSIEQPLICKVGHCLTSQIRFHIIAMKTRKIYSFAGELLDIRLDLSGQKSRQTFVFILFAESLYYFLIYCISEILSHLTLRVTF